MPFDLTSLTSEQCLRFVDRLTTHLQPPASRQRLMAVREAFAKAAGFPDAHAAERAAPPVEFPQALAWASQAWKHHRALLARDPFEEADAEALLAAIWGYDSWMGVTVAISLLSLQGKGNWIHGKDGDTPAVWLGASEKGALGLSERAWEKHVLVIDEDEERRRKLAYGMAAERCLKGDRVVIFDGSPREPLLSDHLWMPSERVSIMDWRTEVPRIQRLANWSRTALTGFLITGVLKREMEPAEDHPFEVEQTPFGVMAWAHETATGFKQLPVEQQTTERLVHMVATDERLSEERRSHWKEAFGKTPPDASEGKPTVEIIRLPSFVDGQHYSAEQACRIALASASVKADLVTRFEHYENSPRLTVVWLDVPLWARVTGWSVVYAQARSLGVTFVEVGSRQSVWAQAKEKEVLVAEAASAIGNLNTKVFGRHALEGSRPLLGRRDAKRLESPQPHEMVGISGYELVRFRPAIRPPVRAPSLR